MSLSALSRGSGRGRRRKGTIFRVAAFYLQLLYFVNYTIMLLIISSSFESSKMGNEEMKSVLLVASYQIRRWNRLSSCTRLVSVPCCGEGRELRWGGCRNADVVQLHHYARAAHALDGGECDHARAGRLQLAAAAQVLDRREELRDRQSFSSLPFRPLPPRNCERRLTRRGDDRRSSWRMN